MLHCRGGAARYRPGAGVVPRGGVGRAGGAGCCSCATASSWAWTSTRRSAPSAVPPIWLRRPGDPNEGDDPDGPAVASLAAELDSPSAGRRWPTPCAPTWRVRWRAPAARRGRPARARRAAWRGRGPHVAPLLLRALPACAGRGATRRTQPGAQPDARRRPGPAAGASRSPRSRRSRSSSGAPALSLPSWPPSSTSTRPGIGLLLGAASIGSALALIAAGSLVDGAGPRMP